MLLLLLAGCSLIIAITDEIPQDRVLLPSSWTNISGKPTVMNLLFLSAYTGDKSML